MLLIDTVPAADPCLKTAIPCRYRVIQAVVGKKRLDELEDQIRAKVTARMAGGAGELLKSFKLFSSGQGEIGPNQMMQVRPRF
jgi:hypothetical protein